MIVLERRARRPRSPTAMRHAAEVVMSDTTVRIAHLSDVHMLASRPSRARARHSLGVRFLSIGRKLDAWRRTRNLARALDAAKRSGAHHFVISGDLTEIGAMDEFEAF